MEGQIIDSKNHLTKNLLLALWLMVFIFHPFSDFQIYKGVSIDKWAFLIGTGISLIIIRKEIIDIILNTSFKYFGMFIIWTFLINAFHGYVNQKLFQYNWKSIIFLFIFLFGIVSYKVLKDDFERALKFLIIVSFLGLIVSGLYVSFSDTYISHGGFFTNQNQLGRYGLTVATVGSLLFYYDRWPFGKNLFPIIIGLSTFAAVAEVRRAAILGFCILFAILLIKYWKECIKALLVLSVCLIGYYQFSEASLNNHIEKVETRFIEEDSAEDHILGRGYQRMFSHPHYLLLGAGEGGIDRFERIWNKPLEIHSTLGSILFCYGIIGLIFMVLYFKGWIFKFDFALLFLIPLFAHSLLHNDIRNIYIIIIPLLFFFLQKEYLIKTTLPKEI